MKHEPVNDHAERKRILALIERCEKEQTMRIIDADSIKIPSTYADPFENCRNCVLLDEEQVREIIDSAPTIKTKQIKYYDEDEKVWKTGEVIVK